MILERRPDNMERITTIELAEAFVFGGKNVQKERLEKDGIEVIDNKVDLKVYQWRE